VQQEFYTASDLKIGEHINVWGRNFLLCDCDEFTKEYYRLKFGLSQYNTYSRLFMGRPHYMHHVQIHA